MENEIDRILTPRTGRRVAIRLGDFEEPDLNAHNIDVIKEALALFDRCPIIIGKIVIDRRTGKIYNITSR